MNYKNSYEAKTDIGNMNIGICNTILFISIICLFFGLCFTAYRFTSLMDYEKIETANVDVDTEYRRNWSGRRSYTSNVDIQYVYEDKWYGIEPINGLDYFFVIGREPSFVYVESDNPNHAMTPYRYWTLPCILIGAGTVVTIATLVKRKKIKDSFYS